MKRFKSCDGYVLPYVLVVFLILSAVAVSICSTSLNNLKAQEAAVERSKALYEAAGEVEKFVAIMREAAKDNGYVNTLGGATDAFWEKVTNAATGIGFRSDASEPGGVAAANFVVTLQTNSADGKACIDAVVGVLLHIDSYTQTEVGDNGEVISSTTYYEVDGITSLTYESYDISYQQPEGGAGDET